MNTQSQTAHPVGELISQYLEAVGRKDESAVDRFFHPDIEYIVNGVTAPDPASGLPPISSDLEKAFPWFGIHRGRVAVKAFLNLLHQNLEVTAYGPRTVISDGGKAAAFGWFRLRALSTGRTIDVGYAVLAEVKEGLITKYQFVENTCAVADAFRIAGVWQFATGGAIHKIPASH
ncbi:nuclear transport factor 2 family protein [Bradyrhizobium sp.]|uniref:nuclear transport factor 2 family protein n=1 Tax=Bradyrhizobium sp. TaxID=376 RepID=UPI002624C097|nr:nuclear transport factor 2 family protein [Bradyrhizobium sp.]